MELGNYGRCFECVNVLICECVSGAGAVGGGISGGYGCPGGGYWLTVNGSWFMELGDYGFLIVTIVAIGTIGRDRGSGENAAEMHREGGGCKMLEGRWLM